MLSNPSTVQNPLSIVPSKLDKEVESEIGTFSCSMDCSCNLMLLIKLDESSEAFLEKANCSV